MKRRHRLITAALFAVLVIVALRFVPTREGVTLLGRATMIGPARNWGMHYFWLDDRRILTFRAKGPDAEAIEVDSLTGRETPLTALSNTFKGIRATGMRHLSPDGTWLLWSGQEPKGRSDCVIASRLDGTERHAWKMGQNTIWSQDGSGWVNFRLVKRTASLRFANLEMGIPRELLIPAVRNTPRNLPGNAPAFQGELLGPTGQGRYLLANTYPVLFNVNQVYLFEIDSQNPSASKCYTAIPPGTFPLKLRLSPNGRRLIWIVAGRNDPTFTTWISRIFPGLGIRRKRRVEIWVSGPSGLNQRMLAQYEPNQSWMDWNRFGDGVNWIPDGRRISFVLSGRLYAISVPEP